jgi:uncharacterized protein YecE (DUF72 family)
LSKTAEPSGGAESWRGPFYPAGLPVKVQLQYVASQFETADSIVFYRTPTVQAVKNWREQTGVEIHHAINETLLEDLVIS